MATLVRQAGMEHDYQRVHHRLDLRTIISRPSSLIMYEEPSKTYPKLELEFDVENNPGMTESIQLELDAKEVKLIVYNLKQILPLDTWNPSNV